MAIPPSATYIRRKQTRRIAEQNINRLVILSVTVAVVGLVASAGPVSAQNKEARGNVSAVTESTMTVKAGTRN